MELEILNAIKSEVNKNKRAALVMITNIEGSTPRHEGSMMVVYENGNITGTIGGGKLELVCIHKAKEYLRTGESKKDVFELTDEEGSLHMQCGGQAEIFFKIFKPDNKLLIVGGGHIALQLYELANTLKFETIIFEDREEYCNKDRFPNANELILGDIEESLANYPIDNNCYVVIITRGHNHDEVALKTVLNRNAAYIGMIGSRNKTKYVMDNLKKDGFDEKTLNEVYAPIGLKLGGETPEDIALSIISEIVLIKNGGSLKHMKE